MSYTYLLDAGQESSAECFWDIPAYVLSRLNLIEENRYCSGSEMESCPSSQSGMMCELSMENLGREKFMSFVGDFLAKIFPQQEAERDCLEKKADYGQNLGESFAKFDRNESSWKTPPCLMFEDCHPYLGTWPRWGIMLNGECWELVIPSGLMEIRRQITNAIESGLLVRFPTPTVSGNYNRKGCSKTSGDGLATVVYRYPTPDSQRGGDGPSQLNRKSPRLQTVIRYSTPNKRDFKEANLSPAIAAMERKKNKSKQLTRQLSEMAHGGNPTQPTGVLNPSWVEWLMGWPIGWSALEPLGMDKFQQWLRSHGRL